MWLFLLTEIMFFGGLFTAYLIYRNWYYPAFVAASHQLNIFWGRPTRASSSAPASPCHGRLVRGDAAQERLGAVPGAHLRSRPRLPGHQTIEYSEKVEKHHVPGFHYSVQAFTNPALTGDLQGIQRQAMPLDMARHTSFISFSTSP